MSHAANVTHDDATTRARTVLCVPIASMHVDDGQFSVCAAKVETGTDSSQPKAVCMTFGWMSNPEWWTSMGTMALVAITGAAVIFAKLAADAAINALKLESEPVLVFTAPGTSPLRIVAHSDNRMRVRDTTEWYIVAKDDAGDIRFTRDVNDKLMKNAPTAPRGGYLEIKNVGRSPAVGITISIYLGTDPHEDGVSLTTGTTKRTFTIDAIGAQSSYFIGVSNQLPETLYILPDVWATSADWSDRRRTVDSALNRKPLPVLSQTFSFPSEALRQL